MGNRLTTFVKTMLLALALIVQGQCCAMYAVPIDTLAKGTDTYPEGLSYGGHPWVQRASRPYAITHGLDGRHLSLWASHGRYYDNQKKEWRWQRPYLFCTTEDLLSQSFVYPFLIPMLERAGAVVFTPRERDSQSLEAIVDNDTPTYTGTYYEKGDWITPEGKGFSLNYPALCDTIFPFETGTSRLARGGSRARAVWRPQIPETGRYAVYVSYTTFPASADNVHYVVHHAGQTSHFRVNQQIGDKTWVYLGHFLFHAGQTEENCVELLAEDSPSGTVVSADCVRFGGGRGRVERSNPDVCYTYPQRMVQRMDTVTTDSLWRSKLLADGWHPDSIPPRILVQRDTIVTDTLAHYLYGKGITSGLPRYLEGARYYAHWAGLPDSLVTRDHGLVDYNDDLRSRSYLLNVMAGGSPFVPDTVGRRVPIELQFALHTDAGCHRNGDIYGSLAIATDYDDYGHTVYRSGLSRKVSERYAGKMMSDVAADLSSLYHVKWPQRELRVKNYSETRSPQVPSMILELLSHQSYRDMTFAHDPNFKFHTARAIYKSLLRQAWHLQGKGEPVVQPLPVEAVSATLRGDKVVLRWSPVRDELEDSAWPTDYVLYSRQGDSDWDDGILTHGSTEVEVHVERGVHYQFRIGALNAGGESFPSEPVSVYLSPTHRVSTSPTVLVVNGFDRLSGPARVESCGRLGFDLSADVGVSYDYNDSFSGAQQNFQITAMGQEGVKALGYSGAELTGLLLAGNRFDGIALHTEELKGVRPDLNVVSMSRAAFDHLSSSELHRYALIDYVAGLQADVPHNLQPYTVFTDKSQALLRAFALEGRPLFVSGAHLGCPAASADSIRLVMNANFMAETLHCAYRAEADHTFSGMFYGMGMEIPIYNRPGELHYPCQRSDILEPVGASAFSAFSYSQGGFSAGVAWTAPVRGIVMAFPFDCISDASVRRTVMQAALDFLLQP